MYNFYLLTHYELTEKIDKKNRQELQIAAHLS